MHRAFFFLRARHLLALLLAGALAPAWAVPVASLYVVMVPGADPSRAVQQAMQVELVRLTGRRSAASDPVLAGLIDNARDYVQLPLRATTTGQIQVLFDEPKLAAALSATGVSLWGADRPLLWISLPMTDAATAQALRTRLTQAAEDRGLPIMIAAPAAAPVAPVAAPAPRAAAAPGAAAAPAAASAAPSASPLSATAALEAAHAAGANAALVGAPLAAQPGTLQWTLSAADGGGQWVGGPELAIDQAADTLASVARAIDQSPLAQYACHVSGVTDLADLVGVLDAMRGASGVTQIELSQIDGDQITLQLAARGSSTQLERALAGDRLQATGTGAEGLLEYRYVVAR